jgi:hypothetical protein
MLTTEPSPFTTVTVCTYGPGNLGAALVDNNQNIRGLFSSALKASTLDFLRAKGLLAEEPESIIHVSNLACLFNRVKNKCSDPKTESRLRKLRSEMLSKNSVHRSNKNRVKKELEAYQKYFKWNVGFFISGDNKTFETSIESPNCYFDTSSWLNEFGSGRRYKNWVTKKISLNNYHFKVKLDKYLKATSHMEKLPLKDYFVSFSPQDIYSKKRTQVSIRTLIFGQEVKNNFGKITGSCK